MAAVYASREEVARRAAAGARAARVWARLLVPRVYVPMLLAFVAGSPFVVLDPLRFGGDFLRQNQIVGRGWLGFEHVGNGFWYNLHTNLGGGIGIVLVVLGVAGVAWALWRRTRLDLMVAPYVVLYYLYISTWKELADRYLLPIAPLLILFAVRFCLELAGLRPLVASRRAAGRGRRARGGVRPAAGVGRVVRPRALRHGHAGRGQGLDRAHGPGRHRHRHGELRTAAGRVVATSRYFTAAGLAQPAYRIVHIPVPLPGDGRRTVCARPAARGRPLRGPQFGRGRPRQAAASIYPARMAFYRDLERTGKLVKEFRPGPGERGPVLKMYELPPAPH